MNLGGNTHMGLFENMVQISYRTARAFKVKNEVDILSSGPRNALSSRTRVSTSAGSCMKITQHCSEDYVFHVVDGSVVVQCVRCSVLSTGPHPFLLGRGVQLLFKNGHPRAE